LKLISLKGFLEKQIPLAIPPNLTDGAIRVMELMDNLL
jgi:phycocyanobilin lyase alpha subunit